MLRYHVINLRSRVDRLLRIRNRLTHPFDVYPAVTPREVAGTAFASPRWHPWTDPLLLRPINAAEVACFLSHFALWTQCAEGSDAFVILEDDVEPIADWNEDTIGRYLGDASGHLSFDLLYLNYREMRQAKPLTGELVSPTYPYWGCAYAITTAAARKLVAAAPLIKGIIPVDEFLATMIGYKHEPPNNGVNDTYADAPVLRAAALRRPLYRTVSREILGSDIEGASIDPTVAVVTVATEYDKAGVLVESTFANRVPNLSVLGIGKDGNLEIRLWENPVGTSSPW